MTRSILKVNIHKSVTDENAVSPNKGSIYKQFINLSCSVCTEKHRTFVSVCTKKRLVNNALIQSTDQRTSKNIQVI